MALNKTRTKFQDYFELMSFLTPVRIPAMRMCTLGQHARPTAYIPSARTCVSGPYSTDRVAGTSATAGSMTRLRFC